MAGVADLAPAEAGSGKRPGTAGELLVVVTGLTGDTGLTEASGLAVVPVLVAVPVFVPALGAAFVD